MLILSSSSKPEDAFDCLISKCVALVAARAVERMLLLDWFVLTLASSGNVVGMLSLLRRGKDIFSCEK